MLDLKQFKQINTLANHGSFVKAASTLGTSQSTLTKHISRIEDIFGEKLFFRSTTGVTATPFCEYVINESQNFMNEYDILNNKLRSLVQSNLECVSILTSPTIYDLLLSPSLLEMYKENTDYKFDVETNDYSLHLNSLYDNKTDCIITALYDEVIPHEYKSVKLYTFDTTFLVHRNHPYFHKKQEKFPVEELLQNKIVCPNLPKSIMNIINKHVSSDTLSKNLTYVQNKELLNDLISSGDYMGVGGPLSFSNLLKTSDYKVLQSELTISISINLLHRNGNKSELIIDNLVHKLTEYIHSVQHKK